MVFLFRFRVKPPKLGPAQRWICIGKWCGLFCMDVFETDSAGNSHVTRFPPVSGDVFCRKMLEKSKEVKFLYTHRAYGHQVKQVLIDQGVFRNEEIIDGIL